MNAKQAQTQELRRAVMEVLMKFEPGDYAVVTERLTGREHVTRVIRACRTDEPYGSWESFEVGASLGIGRFTWDVTGHRLVSGELGIRYATAAEVEAAGVNVPDHYVDGVSGDEGWRERVKMARPAVQWP